MPLLVQQARVLETDSHLLTDEFTGAEYIAVGCLGDARAKLQWGHTRASANPAVEVEPHLNVKEEA